MQAFCYLFYHPEEGFWMGASPETLLEISDKNVTTMALAGTKKRENSEWGNKEIIEQEIVKKEIIKNLHPFCENVKAEGPVTIKAGEIDHLKTVITGFSTASVNDVINAIPEEITSAAIFGHNPTFTYFANQFANRSNHFCDRPAPG